MIKRRLYKQDHGDGDDATSDSSSSSSSSSDSDSEAEPQYDEEVDIEAVSEPKEDEPQPSSGSGYESEDSSGNEVDCDPAGSGYESEDSSGNEVDCDPAGLLNDSDEGRARGRLFDNQSNVRGNADAAKGPSNVLEKEDLTQTEFTGRILKFESVFKCRLCPRIVCLTEESLRAHLQSKRHARSEKLLSEGRLRLMLNSDGEIEEDQETHAERHARTIALAESLTNKKKKNKGRQRQRQRLQSKRKKTSADNPKQPPKNPIKKRKRKHED